MSITSQNDGRAITCMHAFMPYLKDGMKTLETMAEKYQESPMGTHLSLVLAQNMSRPFYRIDKGKLHLYRQANPTKALDLTNRALQQHDRDETTFQNINYHRCSQHKANLLATLGRKREAQQELKKLVGYLKGRGVNKPVLNEISEYAKKL